MDDNFFLPAFDKDTLCHCSLITRFSILELLLLLYYCTGRLGIENVEDLFLSPLVIVHRGSFVPWDLEASLPRPVREVAQNAWLLADMGSVSQSFLRSSLKT